ncbi:MAG: hypothetical protein JXQ76_00290 [Campylobacterales bacterium]|nr:hypothetical protein [Campylobacterales bacterium]
MLRFLTTLMVAFFMLGCGGGGSDSSPTTPAGTNYKSATIGHDGFDFSHDDNNASMDNQDGYTIVWTNYGMNYAQGEEWGSGVWFGVNSSDESNQNLYMYDAGDVSLDSIKSVDTTKWQKIGDTEKSLQVNHVYVIKAKDGYVKFKVLSIHHTTDMHKVSFDAQYQYSATTSFDGTAAIATPNDTTNNTPINPNQKVVTGENANIDDAKLVTDSVESIVATQVIDRLNSSANTQSKYRYASEYNQECAYGGTINMLLSIDDTAGSYGTSSTEVTYVNCHLLEGISMDGKMKHDVSISDLGLQSLVHSYLSDFSLTAEGDTLKIMKDSTIKYDFESGYNSVDVPDGDFLSTAIYNFTMVYNNNTTITRDLAIKNKYEDFMGGKLYTCFSKGALYSSVAPNANPFVIDESYDPTCEKAFIFDTQTFTMLSGSMRFYIGSKKFQTYIEAGEFKTCMVGVDCPNQ